MVHKTLAPKWNEELHVLVQEPTSQLLRVEMFDHDTFNLKVPALVPAHGLNGVRAHEIKQTWRKVSNVTLLTLRNGCLKTSG